MRRNRLPGASRGLGRSKPHVERVGLHYVCFNIVRAGHNHPFIGAEVVDAVGRGSTVARAFTNWFNEKWKA